jgi:hypothetical protein
MWQADISSGHYIKMGKRKVPMFLFAFLDDASRLVSYALYTLDQGFDSLKTVFKEALFRRGIPQMIYTDNGKMYTSQHFQWVCASLGIALVSFLYGSGLQPGPIVSSDSIRKRLHHDQTSVQGLRRKRPSKSKMANWCGKRRLSQCKKTGAELICKMTGYQPG